MSIYRDKKSGQWRFDFDRRIDSQRLRRRQLLPAGWSRAQADAFDRKESAALYAIASGIARPRWTIDEAVERYLKEHAPALKQTKNLRREIDATVDWYTGRALEDLPAVCTEYADDQRGALAPATIKNRISYLRAARLERAKRAPVGYFFPTGTTHACAESDSPIVLASPSGPYLLTK